MNDGAAQGGKQERCAKRGAHQGAKVMCIHGEKEARGALSLTKGTRRRRVSFEVYSISERLAMRLAQLFLHPVLRRCPVIIPPVRTASSTDINCPRNIQEGGLSQRWCLRSGSSFFIKALFHVGSLPFYAIVDNMLYTCLRPFLTTLSAKS